MKLISLNIWGGTLFDPLIKFVAERGKDTDIFCFQEVFNTATDLKTDGDARINILAEFQQALPNHEKFFTSVQDKFNFRIKQLVDYDLEIGMAIFVKKEIQVAEYAAPFIFGQKNSLNIKDLSTFPKILQSIKFYRNNQSYSIFNIHGPWFSSFQEDNEIRLGYFKKVKAGLDGVTDRKILAGDFNLDMDTQSMKLVEAQMTNLIRQNGIKATRPAFYTKGPKVADYILVSKDVEVKNFQVLQDAVSDHLPLALEF